MALFFPCKSSDLDMLTVWKNYRKRDAMKRQLSFRQYRAIDLVLFAVILVFSEYLLVTSASLWYPDQLYTVSVTAALTAIVLMRWGPWGALHAALGGAVFCLASHGSLRQLLIYCAGNLLSLAVLFPLKRLGGERIRGSGFLTVCFGLAVLLQNAQPAPDTKAIGDDLDTAIDFMDSL